MPARKQEPYDLDFVLRRVFKKSSFRPVQREVIRATLEGQDVFLSAATSFGKSLCFQLPAVLGHGITIVISPLLALMNNQIAALRTAGVAVETINSTIPLSHKNAILDDLRCGHPHIRLLYVTPEFCTLDHFRRCLRIVHEQQELSRIAVDEAHCISEWGHDFRRAFQSLSFFKREFPEVPLIALTATATSRVRNDVIETLGLDRRTVRVFNGTVARPNLHFEVRFKNDDSDIYDDFVTWLRAAHARRKQPSRAAELQNRGERPDGVSGIIYTLFRRDCEALAARLCNDRVGARPYHAGLSSDLKDDYLKGWVDNKEGYDVIVATTAFGMGIDKENVRFVVHWQIPKSFEGYYQEAGRAGRDGKASVCMIYYGREDRDRAASLMARDVSGRGAAANADAMQTMQSRAQSLQALVEYCENTNTCRHKIIANYFGDESTPQCEWACDWHKDKNDLKRRKEDGLASEEWCSTQRQSGAYAMDEYD
ncbi:ATP-dependent DNA helicase [Viridothelium virens]|uniref:ATP-dependent DNA helicase n=1 Tax=Viridothelium virens TaxID=1048519 RepID=A0A6A6H7Q6_VIRVR|nr:ATP-dependent DNA helicase [Viridothelium virens]